MASPFSRPAFRTLQSTLRRPQTAQQFRQQISQRWQGTDATTQIQQSAFQKLWNSPVGPKTVHFWAPVMKWGVVLAGVADFARPAEKLSLQQNGALVATGLIWTRWCMIIKPRNILLASVNFLLGCVGIVQCSRIFVYRNSLKNQTAGDAVLDKAKEVKGEVVDAAKGVEGKAKALVQ